MARKDKKTPVQSPPPADSSSDAVTPTSDDDDTTHPITTPSSNKPISNPVPQPSDDGDSDDDSSSPSDTPPTSPNPKPLVLDKRKPKPTTVAASPALQPSKVGESDDEFSSQSDSPPTSPKPKPVVPLKPEPKSKSKPATVAALPASTTKHPSENNATEAKKARKEKEKPSSGPGSSSGFTALSPSQKVFFQRVWSEDDEFMILKGLIEFRDTKGINPMSNPDDFFDFIKRSVRVPDVKKDQLVRKVKSMKTKFFNAVKKNKIFTNRKELEAFNLSKRFWGGELSEPVSAKGNGPALKPLKANGRFEHVEVTADEDEEEVDEGKVKSVGKIQKWEEELIDVESMFSEASGVGLKRVMEMMEGADREEIRKKVKTANVAALEAFVSRSEMLICAAKKVLDDVKSD